MPKSEVEIGPGSIAVFTRADGTRLYVSLEEGDLWVSASAPAGTRETSVRVEQHSDNNGFKCRLRLGA
jgi:hypothetical protein